MENIKKEQKEKFDFKKRKENTLNSLLQVEHFLGDFRNVMKGLKLYKIIKK